MKKDLTVKEMQDIINNFCDIRGWQHKHPNDLISSILIELGELSEHYQWKNEFPKFNKAEKQKVAYEFVDVLFFLLHFANKSDIDLSKAFNEKLPKLQEKFKPGTSRQKAHDNYRKTGKNKLYD